MASLIISYFGGVRDNVPFDPISTETVTTSTTTGECGDIPRGAKVARLYSTIEHYINVGISTDTVTATATNGFYLPASTLYDVGVYQIAGVARQFAAKSFS